MSEEQKDTVKAEQPVEAKESAADEQQPAAEVKSEKNHKINRLSQDKLNKKIEEFEKGNHIQSKYYKHLLQRKQELQAETNK